MIAEKREENIKCARYTPTEHNMFVNVGLYEENMKVFKK